VKQRNKGQELWNGATEKGTLGQLTGVRGRRKDTGEHRSREKGYRDRGQRTGDNEQRSKTGDMGRTTSNNDVRHGTLDRFNFVDFKKYLTHETMLVKSQKSSILNSLFKS